MAIFPDLQSFIPEHLQHFLFKYGEIAKVYVAALDGKGNLVADFSCSEEEKSRVDEIFPAEVRRELYLRVTEEGLEDQVVEETAVSGIYAAASAIKQKGKAQMVWLVLAQIVPGEQSEAVAKAVLVRQTTMSLFFWAIDVLHDIGMECVEAQNSVREWELNKRKKEIAPDGMNGDMARMNVIMEILQYLDSDKAIEFIMQKFLHLTGHYLGTELANVVTCVDGQRRVLAQWGEDNLRLTRMLENGRIEFPDGNKLKIMSYDSSTVRKMQEGMNDVPFKTVVMIPLELEAQNDMYVCYFELKEERHWELEEIQFMKDSIRIFQNILDRRAQKHSVINTHASLEEILESIGCAVLVFDQETGEIQFMNQQTNLLFPKGKTDPVMYEEIRQTLVQQGKFEFCDNERQTWYEAHRNEIRWVDGRMLTLYSIFDVTDKKKYQKRIEQQAYTDFLTGLFNRLCCERDLARTVDDARKNEAKGVLFYLDLDDFKHINDGLGHHYGDILLKNISDELRKIRGIEEMAYRVGGDEFVIIIPPHWYAEYERIIEEIKAIFTKPWYLKDGNYYCTMSMGIVTFPEDCDSVADLIQKADIAMYEAKKGGKNRVVRYDSAILSESGKRLDLEKNMRDATSNGYHEFQIYYQPIIDIQKDGTPCVGAEALIRWNSARMGFISPADFIPLAEYLGLINPIGNHVLKKACEACKRWNDNGRPNFKVNVNLSVIQLLQNNIVEIVEETIRETGIDPRNLTLEVTENLAINDMERMKGIMRRIRQLGVRIALDDFGTGYSSLNHIREIPLDVIKVDQSFVRDLVEDDYSKAFVKMVAELAGTLGVSICVEGIEKFEQYKVLENMKVRMVQGYYFDRPMPLDMFEDKYVLN